ncbi:hypothetical protein ADUPG1_011283, partial [Aduncisulcus paluster]
MLNRILSSPFTSVHNKVDARCEHDVLRLIKVDAQDKSDKKDEHGELDNLNVNISEYNFKGYKVLIVMLFDYSVTKHLDPETDRLVTKEVFSRKPFSRKEKKEESDGKFVSPGAILDFHHIGYDVVMNYEDAIERLLSGKYGVAWVIPSQKGMLPIDPATGAPASPVRQDVFIDALIEFWRRSGCIFWLPENDTYHELNLFLEKVEFDKIEDGEGQSGKFRTRLRVSEESYVGGGIIKKMTEGEEKDYLSGKIIPYGKFIKNSAMNSSSNSFDVYARLEKCFEGKTIATFNCRSKSDLVPFEYAFVNTNDRMRKGAMPQPGSLIYLSPTGSRCGSMIIDTAFTKLFIDFKAKGTSIWIQNCAIWLQAQFKRKRRHDVQVDFPLDVKDRFKQNLLSEIHMVPSKKYDRTNFIFLLDYSGSMNAEISADKSETKTRKDCLINALQSGVIDTLAAKFPHRSCPHLLSVCTFNDDCARVKLPHQEKLTPYNGRSWLSKLKETRPSGETIFSKGLQYARRSLRKRDYGNVLILFTDGANRESDERVTREEMKKLREKFDVYIIGIKDATS